MFVKCMAYPGDAHVLAWRLDEEAPRLLALCSDAGIPVTDLVDLPVKRLRERAAERLLLCRAFGLRVTLEHDGQGVPFVAGSDENISISHTRRLVVLAWHEREVIGIDAEQTDRRQVLRVRDKFLNDKEKCFILPDDLAAHVIAWTAKEAVIKAERNSAIDWTDGICLSPFSTSDHLTILEACCADRCYRLTCRQIEDHYITVATPVAK